MKQAHVLIAATAFVSVLTMAQSAVAEEQGVPTRELIAQQETVPAEWREQRLDVAPMSGAGDQMARAQAQADQGMIPAEWREQRLDMAPVPEASDRQARARTDQAMIPAEWREQRLDETPMMGASAQN